MKKSYRQLLLFAATVAFLAVAPMAVFYAIGYRVAIDAGEQTSVGVLLIETVPKGARITLNHREAGTSPQAFTNLPPGEVDVALSLQGYAPWQKKVRIEPTTVTELRGVRLLPAPLTVRPLLVGIDHFALSPSRRLIAAARNNIVYLIDEEGNTLKLVRLPPGAPPQHLLWSPDSNQVLLLYPAAVRLLHLALPGVPGLIPELAQARDIVWDPRIPGRILAITPAGQLFAYQTATSTRTPLSDHVATFATSARQIFVLDSSEQQLTILNLQGQPIRSLTLPEPVERLLVAPTGQVAVHYQAGGLAALGEAGQLIPVSRRVETAGFSPDGQLLYVQEDATSLHVFNISDERLRHVPLYQLQLVTRLSRPIRDPQWFAGGQHLIYQLEDEIVITEIDTRDRPVSITVDTTNLGASEVSVGREGEQLFYLKRIGATPTLVVGQLLP